MKKITLPCNEVDKNFKRRMKFNLCFLAFVILLL